MKQLTSMPYMLPDGEILAFCCPVVIESALRVEKATVALVGRIVMELGIACFSGRLVSRCPWGNKLVDTFVRT